MAKARIMAEKTVDKATTETVATPEVTVPADASTPTTEVAIAPATEVPEVLAKVYSPSPSPDLGEHDHFAIRDFKARFEHQVLSFVKDELIDSHVGRALRALGAPIRVAAKKPEEIKADA